MPSCERALGELDERVVERLLEPVVLAGRAAPGGALGQRAGTCSIGDRSSPEAFQCSDRLRGVQQVGPADRLVQRAEAERGQVLADLLRR